MFLRLAAAKDRISAHHGSAVQGMGGARGGNNHGLAAIRMALFGNNAKGGKQKSGARGESWNCETCGMYNFEHRRICRTCSGPPPKRGATGSTWESKGRGKGSQEESSAPQLAALRRELEAEKKKRQALEAGYATPKAEPSTAADGKGDDEETGTLDAEIDVLQRAFDNATKMLGHDHAQTLECKKALAQKRETKDQGKSVEQRARNTDFKLARKRKSLEVARASVEKQTKVLEEAKAELEEMQRKAGDLEAEVATLEEAGRVLHLQASKAGPNKATEVIVDTLLATIPDEHKGGTAYNALRSQCQEHLREILEGVHTQVQEFLHPVTQESAEKNQTSAPLGAVQFGSATAAAARSISAATTLAAGTTGSPAAAQPTAEITKPGIAEDVDVNLDGDEDDCGDLSDEELGDVHFDKEEGETEKDRSKRVARLLLEKRKRRKKEEETKRKQRKAGAAGEPARIRDARKKP